MTDRESTRPATAGELKELVSTMELLRSLECPICTEIPLPPIYQCQNGHHICSSCKLKLTQCGICNGKLTNTRNYAVESIIGGSKFKCLYGCDEIVKGDQQEAHGKNCRFRPIPCNELSGSIKCNGKRILFKDYFKHLIDVHKIAGETNSNSNTFPITSSAPDLLTDRRFPSFYMVYDKHQFVSNVNLKDGMMQWWVTMIGGEDEAAEYMAKLLLYDSHNLDVKIEWNYPVHSIRKSPEDIRKSALYATIPVTNMQPFIREAAVANSTTGQKKQCWSTKYTLSKVSTKKLPKNMEIE